eukprot:SAG31_NODE_1101_length_9905_cov_3.367122_10_plen_126_part_00
MLPRLGYHDYRRVCQEQEAARRDGVEFAEIEPWSNKAGLPVIGVEKLRRNLSLKRRSEHRKIAYYKNQKQQMLARLATVRERTSTPVCPCTQMRPFALVFQQREAHRKAMPSLDDALPRGRSWTA